MKKFLFLAVAAVSFVACNNKPAENQAEEAEAPVEVVEEAAVAVDSVAPDTLAVVEAADAAVVAE